MPEPEPEAAPEPAPEPDRSPPSPPDGSIKGRARGLYDVHGEKLRYLIVGVWNTAISYIAFVICLKYLGPPLQSLESSSSAVVALLGHYYYLVIQWGVWVVMVVHSTTTMKYIAFRSPGHWGKQVLRAYLVYLPMQFLSTFLLWLTVKVLGLHPAVGQLITIAFVTVFSYLGHKYFTFREPGVTLEAEEWGAAVEDEVAE